MMNTVAALLRCLAIVGLIVIVGLAGFPALIGWLLTAIFLPIAERANDAIDSHRRALRQRA